MNPQSRIDRTAFLEVEFKGEQVIFDGMSHKQVKMLTNLQNAAVELNELKRVVSDLCVKVPVLKNKPFEVEKTYKTTAGDYFEVTSIGLGKDNKQVKVFGLYLDHKHLGICSLTPEQLVAEKEQIGEEWRVKNKQI